jgi:3-hydroxyacyl-[acyl-carrier-protein] dehydratase
MSETKAPSGTVDIVDCVRIMQLIPHRPPFLMIDQVRDLRAGEGAVGVKNVTMTEPHFQGHFPGAPVMPGVLIVEAMAQTAAVLVVHTLGPEAEGKLVYFMSIDNCRFRRPVFPGDQLLIEVNKQRNRGPVWKFEGIAKVDGKIVAEAVIAAMFREHR